jgi:hypothetical protein
MVVTREKEGELPKEGNTLSINERELLGRLAERVPPESVIVEISDDTSEITGTLAGGADNGGIRVFHLPLHGNDYRARKTDSIKLQRGISKTEKTNGVTILHEGAYGLSRHWKATIGLLVVAGYHRYEETREAVVCWQGHLSPDVAVVIHNCHESGPARTVEELVNHCGNFVVSQAIGDLTVLVEDKCQHHWVINSNEVGACRTCERKRDFRRLDRETISLRIMKRTMRRINQ